MLYLYKAKLKIRIIAIVHKVIDIPPQKNIQTPMPHCTAHSTSGTCPSQTIFAKKRWRGGRTVKKTPLAVLIAKRRIEWNKEKNRIFAVSFCSLFV